MENYKLSQCERDYLLKTMVSPYSKETFKKLSKSEIQIIISIVNKLDTDSIFEEFTVAELSDAEAKLMLEEVFKAAASAGEKYNIKERLEYIDIKNIKENLYSLIYLMGVDDTLWWLRHYTPIALIVLEDPTEFIINEMVNKLYTFYYDIW